MNPTSGRPSRRFPKIRPTSAEHSAIERLEPRTLLAATPVGPEFRVGDATGLGRDCVDVAADPYGNSVMVWQGPIQDGNAPGPGGGGIYAQRFSDAGERLGDALRVDGGTVSEKLGASVAMDEQGDFVVTWASHRPHSAFWNIVAQRYDRDGVARGGNFRVDVSSTRFGSPPDLAMDRDGDFVVGWASRRTGGAVQILVRRYDSEGRRRGGLLNVDSIPKGRSTDGSDPSVAMDRDGGFVVAWSRVAGTDSLGVGGSVVYAQCFNAAGEKQSAILAPGSRPIPQEDPAVAMDEAGNFTVAWAGMADSGGRIYGQRYNANGQMLGGEFRASPSTQDAVEPAISMDSNGASVLTWRSQTADGATDGIYARLYDPEGHAAAGPFRANTSRTGYESNATAAIGASSRVVIAWTGYGSDGNSPGVYAQQFRGFSHPGTVAGAAWNDANGDGVRQWRERPMAGVTVGLFNDSGALAGTTRTDLRGAYSFDVMPGAGYYLEFSAPPRTYLSPMQQGDDSARDSDVDPYTGRSPVFFLDPSSPRLTLGAGFVRMSL